MHPLHQGIIKAAAEVDPEVREALADQIERPGVLSTLADILALPSSSRASGMASGAAEAFRDVDATAVQRWPGLSRLLGTVAGGALGAAAGGAVTHASGGTTQGAVLGGGIGAIAGSIATDLLRRKHNKNTAEQLRNSKDPDADAVEPGLEHNVLALLNPAHADGRAELGAALKANKARTSASSYYGRNLLRLVGNSVVPGLPLLELPISHYKALRPSKA